jgi:chromosome segregation ATPase
MTEMELQTIEARLPKGMERVGTHLDASHLAAAVRNAWSEGAELRQDLTDIRNSGARLALEREAATALADRYKAERDALVERCGRLRKTLAELLGDLQGRPTADEGAAETLAKARRVLDEAF